MTQKLRKILFLLLSFILLSLNTKIFAQEVIITKPISEGIMYDLKEELSKVRELLNTFKSDYVNQVAHPKIKRGHDSRKYWDHIGLVQKKAEQLDKAYCAVLDKAYTYTDYVLEEEGKTALERATQGYLGVPELQIKNYHLEEGAVFKKIQELLKDLEKAWFREERFYDILKVAWNQEPVINDLINTLDNRLQKLEGVIDRSISRNEMIYTDNMAEIIQKHISRENVLSAALERIPEEERKAIKLYLKANNLKGSNISIASGVREYLIFMGKKDVPSVFKLVKSGVLHSLEMEEFKQTVSKKWKNVIDDFPIFKNGRYIPPEYTMRRLLRSTPLMAVGAVLSAGAIFEIRSNNNFSKGSLGARMISEIKRKIDKGEASFAETVLYYSDERSSSVVNKNPEHLISSISLALAVKQANKDFDIIAKSVQAEAGNKYAAVSEEEIQNNFDIFYDKVLQRVEDGLI